MHNEFNNKKTQHTTQRVNTQHIFISLLHVSNFHNTKISNASDPSRILSQVRADPSKDMSTSPVEVSRASSGNTNFDTTQHNTTPTEHLQLRMYCINHMYLLKNDMIIYSLSLYINIYFVYRINVNILYVSLICFPCCCVFHFTLHFSVRHGTGCRPRVSSDLCCQPGLWEGERFSKNIDYTVYNMWIPAPKPPFRGLGAYLYIPATVAHSLGIFRLDSSDFLKRT